MLLISQDQVEVELYRRQEEGSWVIQESAGAEASVELTSIGYTLQLRELYENVAG